MTVSAVNRQRVRRAAGGRHEVPDRGEGDTVQVALVKILGLLLFAPVWYAVRHPILTCVAASTVWVATLGVVPVLGLWAGIGVGLAGWRLVHPGSFAWLAFRLLAFVRGGWVYRRRWAQVVHLSGLGVDLGGGIRYAPHIVKVRADAANDLVRVKLLPSQTPEDFETHADELAHAFGMLGCRIQQIKPGVIVLVFARRDALAEPVAALPIADTVAVDPVTGTADMSSPVDAQALHVGVCEDGSPWRLRLLHTHVLLVGATGAGKGSVLWSTVRALAPSIAAGSTQVWACDPKGGIELAPGRAMFSRFAHDPEPMVELVEDAAELVRDRAARLRGTARTVTPTTADPHIVVVIDELAYLTAYMPDRDLRKRLDDALQVVLSQGRAVGVSVIGAVQDPRKDVIRFRDLFPTRIALRLTEAAQVGLVLGDGTHDRGALCERIPHATPGVGYVLLEGHREPVRIRAAYVSDDDITTMAQTHPAPAAGAATPGAAGAASNGGRGDGVDGRGLSVVAA